MRSFTIVTFEEKNYAISNEFSPVTMFGVKHSKCREQKYKNRDNIQKSDSFI